MALWRRSLRWKRKEEGDREVEKATACAAAVVLLVVEEDPFGEFFVERKKCAINECVTGTLLEYRKFGP